MRERLAAAVGADRELLVRQMSERIAAAEASRDAALAREGATKAVLLEVDDALHQIHGTFSLYFQR